MPITLAISAVFGSGKAGLNTVGYTVLHLDRTTAQARTTTGVTEVGGGIYAIAASIPDGVTAGYIQADTGETVPRPWVAGFNPNDLLSKADLPAVDDQGRVTTANPAVIASFSAGNAPTIQFGADGV